jgi:hypothetical protein
MYSSLAGVWRNSLIYWILVDDCAADHPEFHLIIMLFKIAVLKEHPEGSLLPCYYFRHYEFLVD